MTTPRNKHKRHPRRPAPRVDMPHVIYVIKGGGDEPTLFGHENFQHFDDGEVVGVYDLREVRTMVVTKGLR